MAGDSVHGMRNQFMSGRAPVYAALFPTVSFILSYEHFKTLLQVLIAATCKGPSTYYVVLFTLERFRQITF